LEWKPKKNVELINKIRKQVIKTQQLVKEPIKWRHIYGHQKIGGVDMVWNNYVDKLAANESNMIL
jgi:hypothetical protein